CGSRSRKTRLPSTPDHRRATPPTRGGGVPAQRNESQGMTESPSASQAGKRRYFGTDGIRGRVGTAPISADFVLRLGNAYGHALRASARQAGAGEWRRPAVI